MELSIRVLGWITVFGLMLGAASGAQAQEPGAVTITLQVSNCPPGMTADTLDADACSPVTDGFDVEIYSLEGVMDPATLADASFAGSAYTWTFAASPAPNGSADWSLQETTFPDGYVDYVAVGDAVTPEDDGYRVSTTGNEPDAFVAIYNFAPVAEPESGDEPAQAEQTGQSPEASAEAPTGRAAVLHQGTCDAVDPGEIVAELGELVTPTGDSVGQEGAVRAETAFASVPLSLAEILGANHAISIVVLGEDAPAVACGQLGGALNADGDLVVGLREADGSGFAGIAFLSPVGDSQATVSVFVAEGLAE